MIAVTDKYVHCNIVELNYWCKQCMENKCNVGYHIHYLLYVRRVCCKFLFADF